MEKIIRKRGAGILFISDEKILLVKRSKIVNNPGTWGIPGGNVETDGPLIDEAKREVIEELLNNDKSKLPFFSIKETIVFENEKRTYTTFICPISKEEKIKLNKNIILNEEHDEWKWFPLSAFPDNLHFGVRFLKKNLPK